MNTVLIVEDERAILELVAFASEASGFHALKAGSVAEAKEKLSVEKPDIIVLDWMLPDCSGLEWLVQLRASEDYAEIPVVLLTARGTEEDRVSGLEAGADDYVVKPFSPRELVARLRAVLRRRTGSVGTDTKESVLQCGPLTMDELKFEATVSGQPVKLGVIEFKLLQQMAKTPGRVYSREQLLSRVWDDDAATIDERTVDVHILRLRKQLSATEIAFLIFPSNRGGYCVQPVRKENSFNYKYDFPETWLGLEKEALQEATGLSDVSFCHKGGFLLTAETLDDAVAACRISLAGMPKAPVLIHIGTDAIDADDALLRQMPGMEHAVILHKPLPEAPELNICGSYAVSSLEKAEWKIRLREYLSDLLKEKPEAVCVSGDLFAAYPVMHQLRKKHIPVLTVSEQNGKRLLIRIPSGS